MATSSSPTDSNDLNSSITLDDEDFDFLDSVTALAILQSELDDARSKLARNKNNGHYAPLALFRGSRAVAASDISSSLWCEQQVEYRHLHPYLKSSGEWAEREAQGRPVVQRTAIMMQGSSYHMKKELEVHVKVEVRTLTREDKWAVDLVNTYTQLAAISQGGMEREIKVFGYPFGHGTMVTGILDQLEYSAQDHTLILLELKTRRQLSVPGAEQRRSHDLQLMLYKNLLDQLTQGKANWFFLLQEMKLDMSMPLSMGPLLYVRQLGLDGFFTPSPSHPNMLTLGQLTTGLGSLVVGLDLPLVTTLLLQYEHQSSGEVIGVELVLHEEDWAKKLVGSSLEFWQGQRAAGGVDIEEAWKCHSCQFHDVCVRRISQLVNSSPVKHLPSEIFS